MAPPRFSAIACSISNTRSGSSTSYTPRARYWTSESNIGLASVEDFEVEIGGMDYGFPIGGILGMDFMLQAGAMIDLERLEIEFS